MQHPTGEPLYIGPQRFEVGIGAVVAEGVGHGGDILHAALEGHAHGAAVVAVHRAVVSVVDASDDHIRLSGEYLGEGHRVCRCTTISARPRALRAA